MGLIGGGLFAVLTMAYNGYRLNLIVVSHFKLFGGIPGFDMHP